MRRIKFSEFELDLELFTLQRNNSPIAIGQRPLDLLVCLIQNRERVVDLKFLRREVWNSVALSPAAIPTCVRELRLALGDSASNPRFIESTRGRGYRFIAEVKSAPRSQLTPTQPFEELPFVGRKTEMRILRQLLHSSIAEARGHLILIRGEAGIGKTRLLTEFVKTIPTTVRSYVARGSAIEGTPAFWPWTKILREALTAQKGTNQELVKNAQSLSTAFPEIQGSVDYPPNRPTNLDRFSILSRWVETIRSISRGTPLLLAFEDIHRADHDSLSLLAWIVEELSFDPVIVIATHRPSPETNVIAQGLSDIAALPRCKNIDLAPLTAHDISFMLDPLSSDRTALSKALELRTAGNAFYVTHLIRYLDSRINTESTESLVSALPSNGREIVSRQLSDLPTSTRNALAVASVAGGTFSIPTTAEILGISSKELLSQLETARRAWLIREDGCDFVFSHALLRDALYQTIDSSRRREIHLQLARDLIKHRDSRSTLISDHLTKALPLTDSAEVRKFALLAGRDTAARFAYSEAQIFFRRALDLVESDSECSVADRCKILLEYANAQLYAGDRERARKTLLEAARLARRADSGELLAACALQLAPDFLAIEIGSYDAHLISMLRESLDSLPQNLLSLRAQLLARLSNALLWSRDSLDSEQLAIDALQLARRSGDATSLSAALAARADSLTGPHRVQERMRVTRELQKTVREKNNLPDSVMQHVRLISALLELGDLRAVDAAIDSCERVATDMNVPQYLWYGKTFRAMRKLMEGDFVATHRLAKESHELGDKHGDENVLHSRACQTTCIFIEQNQAAAALSTISAMASRRPLVRAWRAGTGYIHLMSQQPAEAQMILESFNDSEIQLLFRETGGSAGVAFLAEIAAEAGDVGRRSLLYDLCSTAPERSATLGYAIAYFGCFSRYAGILAHTLGLESEAIEHLRAAIDIESKRGAILYRAHAALDLSQVLIESELGSDEVRELLSSVQSINSNSAFHRISSRLTRLQLQIGIT